MSADHHEIPGATEGVAIDVGAGMGALVVFAPAELIGLEIELSPAGAAARRTHSVFHERHTATGPVYAAVFPTLLAGRYELWWGDDPPRPVAIADGAITEEHLDGV